MSKYLQTYLGSIFIGYTSRPSLVHHNCLGASSQHDVTVTYYFPAQFINYACSLRIQYQGLQNLKCSLSIAQQLPPSHEIWHMIYWGNIDGVRTTLYDNRVSIRAQDSGGMGLLWVSPSKRYRILKWSRGLISPALRLSGPLGCCGSASDRGRANFLWNRRI